MGVLGGEVFAASMLEPAGGGKNDKKVSATAFEQLPSPIPVPGMSLLKGLHNATRAVVTLARERRPRFPCACVGRRGPRILQLRRGASTVRVS